MDVPDASQFLVALLIVGALGVAVVAVAWYVLSREDRRR